MRSTTYRFILFLGYVLSHFVSTTFFIVTQPIEEDQIAKLVRALRQGSTVGSNTRKTDSENERSPSGRFTVLRADGDAGTRNGNVYCGRQKQHMHDLLDRCVPPSDNYAQATHKENRRADPCQPEQGH
uniref:Putative er protein with keel retention signal n=1 Tax=Ixodes ricinus TaxID=34613 RepID=A0A090XDI4_IXORI